jgi:hypothetical protein
MARSDPAQSGAPPADAAHADVGIVCALAREMAPLLERCEKVRKYTGGSFTFRGGRYDQVRLAVVESGLGFARARRRRPCSKRIPRRGCWPPGMRGRCGPG